MRVREITNSKYICIQIPRHNNTPIPRLHLHVRIDYSSSVSRPKKSKVRSPIVWLGGCNFDLILECIRLLHKADRVYPFLVITVKKLLILMLRLAFLQINTNNKPPVVACKNHMGSVAVVVVLTLTRIIKSVVTGQAPVTLELRNTPGKHTHTTQGGTRIYHS